MFTWTWVCISEALWKDSCGWPKSGGEFLHQVSIDELQSSVNRKILLLLLPVWQVTLLPCLSQQFNSYPGNGFSEVMGSQALEQRQAGRLEQPSAGCRSEACLPGGALTIMGPAWQWGRWNRRPALFSCTLVICLSNSIEIIIRICFWLIN